MTPTGIEFVEVAGDKAAMGDWIGPGWESLPLKCALLPASVSHAVLGCTA